MADDMKMQIILEGVNDTAPAFAALNDAIKGLTNAALEFSRTLSSIFADPSKEAAQQIRSIGEGFKSVETSAAEAASALARDFEDAAKKSEEAMAKVGNGAPGGHGGHSGGLFGLQGQMDSMYAGMGMGAMAFPFVEAIKSSIETFAQFDQAVHNVASMMPEGTKAVKGMEDQLTALSQVVPQSATDLAKGLYGIVGAGVPAADAMNVLKIAAEAAAGGQTDVGTASNALIFVLDSYGMSAKEATKVSDELFAANQSGAMTFPQLANAIGTVSGAAAQAGIGFDQIAAATAALSNQGITAQRATLGLRALLMGIMAPTAGATKEAHALGIEWDANALKQKGLSGMMQEAMKATGGNSQELKKLIPNIAAWTVAMDLGGKGAGAYKQAMEAMANSTGATEKAMETQEQGAAAQLEKFRKNLQNLQDAFAVQILPTINDFMAKIEDMMNWFGNLSDGTKKLIGEVVLGAGAFLTFGSALFMSISAIGSVVTGIKSIGLAFAALEFNPVILAITAVVAAVALAAYEIYTHWGQIKTWLENTWNAIKTSAESIWNSIKNTASQIWNSIVTGVQSLWNGFKSWIVNTTTSIANGVVAGFQWLYNHNYYFKDLVDFINKTWSDLKQWTTDSWNEITKWLSDTWTTITSTADSIWTPIADFFSKLWDGVSSTASSMWNSIKSNLSGLWNGAISDAENIWNGLSSYFSGLWSQAEQWGSNLIHMFVSGIKNVAGEVGDAISNIGHTIADWLGFHSPSKMLPDSDKWMPNMMNMLAGGINNNISLISDASASAGSAIQNGITSGANQAVSAVSASIASVQAMLASIGGYSTGGSKYDAIDRGVDTRLGIKTGDSTWGSGSTFGVKDSLGGKGTYDSSTGKGSWDYSHLASGGFITGPTFAMIGEGGEPEVVSPLSEFTRSIIPAIMSSSPVGAYAGGGLGGGRTNVYITVQANGNITRNEQELGDIVSRAVWNKMKLQGRF